MNKIKAWIAAYCATPWHQWWVKKVWKPSWSRLWNLILGIPSFAVVAGQYVSNIAGDDKINTLLQKMHVPDGVFVALATAALVGYIAVGRN